MRKTSPYTRHLVILAVIGVIGGLALPGYSWSKPFLSRIFSPTAYANPPAITGSNPHTIVAPTEKPALRAAGRGAPWINLGDGVEVGSAYTDGSAFVESLQSGDSESLSLADGDFDEDGAADLISGHAAQSGGHLILRRGNIDSVYPNSPASAERKATGEFTASAFWPQAKVIALPEAPDFLGAGDFDADGHLDLVTTSKAGDALYFLSGDGRGSFGRTERIELNGQVTALVTGDINRADGLTDIAVAVATPEGAKALVFEGPEGALKARPEDFRLPAEADALALGHMDRDGFRDLAVAAGSHLFILHGRDRDLSMGSTRQTETPQADITRTGFESQISQLAVGDFVGDRRDDLALMTADGSVRLLDLTNRRAPRLGVAYWRPAEGLTASRAAMSGSLLVASRLSTSVRCDLLVLDRAGNRLHVLVSGAGAAEASSIEIPVEGDPVAALPMHLNSDALGDLVILRRDATAPAVALSAPVATFTVINNNDGGDGSLRKAILDANATPEADQISFQIGTGARTIALTSALPAITAPLTIDATTQPGFAGAPLIELNGLGTAAAVSHGLLITSGSTRVTGLVINRFRGSGVRIETNGNNIIEGNHLGTDIAGAADQGNGEHGVIVVSPSTGNTIGGITPAARNIISGNELNGVALAAGNILRGNFVGTTVAGTIALGNSAPGVFVGGGGNTIGGTAAGARNVISGGLSTGIYISGGAATANLVQGNFIGVSFGGTTDLGNTQHGVHLDNGASANTIGGTTATARNVISGNNGSGVVITSLNAADNKVQGNFIGVDSTGGAALGNSSQGVLVAGAAHNTVGGTTVGARNVISANLNGVKIEQSNTNIVQGNFIGTNSAGTDTLGNTQTGVLIDSNASENMIGGIDVGAGNTIAFNAGKGVSVLSGTRNAVLSNSLFSPAAEAGLVIDLGGDGPTANDQGDRDSGPNDLQNFPVLTFASTTGAITNIRGTFNSRPFTTYTLQFFSNGACAATGLGQGQAFIANGTVSTDSKGNASINITLPVATALGRLVTAIATDPNNNTSEFSRCAAVTIFDACIQDDTNGNTLLFSTATGDYVFTQCGRGKKTLLTGKGVVAVSGCTITIVDSLVSTRNGYRLAFKIDTCNKRGSGALKFLGFGPRFDVDDKNTATNTCGCL